MGPCGPGPPAVPLSPGRPSRPSRLGGPATPSLPSCPGCPSLPSLPGSPGRQDALVTGQVSAASVVRYTAVKQVRATRNLTVRGGICHLQLFFFWMLKPYCKTFSGMQPSLRTATCLLALICRLLSCLFFYLPCTSSVNHGLFDVVCITRPACAHYRSGSGLLICHSVIWHQLHWMLEVII